MTTMVDEIFDRQYQAGRTSLNNGLELAAVRAVRTMLAGFERLNRIQFAAPWTSRRSGPGCA